MSAPSAEAPKTHRAGRGALSAWPTPTGCWLRCAIDTVHALTGPPVFGAVDAGAVRAHRLVPILAGLLLIRRAGAGPPPALLVCTHACVDTGAVALLLYSSGGVTSGLAILLVIPVARWRCWPTGAMRS
jgi:hypothetical protein